MEYEITTEALAAIDSASGGTLLEQAVQCDYAFVRPPPSGPRPSYDFTEFTASLEKLTI